MLTLTLPYPPTTGNHQHGWRRGKAYTLPEVSEYRITVGLCALTISPRRVHGQVVVTLDLWPPDKRVRDADNALKIIFDALVRASVIEDDSNRVVIEQRVRWHEADGEPRVEVTVEERKQEGGAHA